MRFLKNTILSLSHFDNNVFIRSNKSIKYESIDFTFKPNHFYRVIKLSPTQFKIPNIPYSQQYESRDFNKEIIKPSQKVLMNREKYIKEFNPYLRNNVSENLDEKILKFYRERYLTRW